MYTELYFQSLLLWINFSKFVGRQPIPLTLFPLKGLISHGPFSILAIHVIICPESVYPRRLQAPVARVYAAWHSLAQGQLWAAIQPSVILTSSRTMEFYFDFALMFFIG